MTDAAARIAALALAAVCVYGVLYAALWLMVKVERSNAMSGVYNPASHRNHRNPQPRPRTTIRRIEPRRDRRRSPRPFGAPK